MISWGLEPGGMGAAPPDFGGNFFNRVPPPDFGGFCSEMF